MDRALLAYDKSARRYDVDGHLHVEMTNISKANVCSYLGKEIPDFANLGLHPDKVYNLYRDPGELNRARDSFANKPLLMEHVEVLTAEEPERASWVGVVGAPVEFDGTYLRAPLAVWDGDAIQLIESRKQEQLSPAYRYRADMTPGRSPDGFAYDGVMRDIMGNHVALVERGRTGPDVVVADKEPSFMIRSKFVTALAALFSTAPQQEQLVALDAALEAELKTVVPPPSVSPPSVDVEAIVATRVTEATKDLVTKVAMDEAVAAAREEVHALYAARKAVETTVGVIALDSAEAVYRFALDHLKVDHKNSPAKALPALYETATRVAQASAPSLASDAAAFDLAEILGLSHIRKA